MEQANLRRTRLGYAVKCAAGMVALAGSPYVSEFVKHLPQPYNVFAIPAGIVVGVGGVGLLAKQVWNSYKRKMEDIKKHPDEWIAPQPVGYG